MDSMPVNWEALDSLVIDFAKSENLLEDSSSSSPSSSPSSSSSSSSYRSRLLIRQIRRSLEAGDVDAAGDLLRLHAPLVLDDRRLLFRLQKQKFIELLRKGTATHRDSALECLRRALAPCALDAYPEAYEEFKHVLLALIFDKEDYSSPVAYEWSERRRFDVAGLLSSVLRSHLQAYDPIFSMTLRYLISIHKIFCVRQGISSPISDLTERLLFEDRDLPAIPEACTYDTPPFDEVDIQALAHAVELTRHSAIESLRFAKGDLFQAFQNELCRIKLDVAMLDDLVREYCVYRGMVDGVHNSPSGMHMLGYLKTREPNHAHDSLRDYSSPCIDCGTSGLSDDETSVSNTVAESARAVYVVAASPQVSDAEIRSAYEVASNTEDCSTSDTNMVDKYCRRFWRSRSHASGHRSKRRRWKGRVESLETVANVPCVDIDSQELMHSSLDSSEVTLEEDKALEKRSSLEHVDNIKDLKHEVILELRELANKGMTAEVVEEVNAMDPYFFGNNPVLLFQLKQVEFLKLVSAGDHSRALSVASSYLGPLASGNPELLKPLKETLFALLRPKEDALAKCMPLSVLATSLQVAMGGRLGIEEPLLMKMMRAILHTHNEWFRFQMCKDRFEGLLKIDHLKEIDSSLSTDATSKTFADNCTDGSSQSSVTPSSRILEDGSSPAQISSGDNIYDESAILKVMEFLALPRADAIHLLVESNGNAEAVIQQLFT